MKDRPLVSVIIPCFKQADFLAETIGSALAQTYSPVEILVVNDGSPDDTEKVAKSYGDRIVYIERPNGGLSAARNTAIAQAKGRYLKFLDSDDQLHPEQIARQVEALAGREDSLALTATRLYRDGKPEEFLDHIPQAKALLPNLFLDFDWGAPIAWLFPTLLVKAVGGFDESFRFFEDLDLLTKLGAQGVPLVVDRRIGCYYRQRAGSMSANRVGMASARARIFIRLHDQLRVSGRPDWFGLDLLKAEQAAYQQLVQLQMKAPELLDSLLKRIGELQLRVGFGQYGWRFRLLTRLLGYARAERLRSWIVRRLKIQPQASLDTQAWRYQT
jgi:glycosyltransferase involved in cell wall biosynthesis